MTVTHGLVTTPTRIEVLPTGNVGNWWVSGMDATSFVINVETAPSGGIGIYWEAKVR